MIEVNFAIRRLFDHPDCPTLVLSDHPPTLQLFAEICRYKLQSHRELTMIANGFASLPLTMTGVGIIPVTDSNRQKRAKSMRDKLIKPIVHTLCRISNPLLSSVGQARRVTETALAQLQDNHNVMMTPAGDTGLWGEGAGLILRSIAEQGLASQIAVTYLYLLNDINSNILFDSVDTLMIATQNINWNAPARRLSRAISVSFENMRPTTNEKSIYVSNASG